MITLSCSRSIYSIKSIFDYKASWPIRGADPFLLYSITIPFSYFSGFHCSCWGINTTMTEALVYYFELLVLISNELLFTRTAPRVVAISHLCLTPKKTHECTSKIKQTMVAIVIDSFITHMRLEKYYFQSLILPYLIMK
ncbi:unnamed protein product [Phytomonas sp. Hart1]|nr:unnamed protein product [Phytomonas sp. Hart1]|eukprot:CCW70011.1 unnamed protein product [Phytomonas sp. isolate Hart1]